MFGEMPSDESTRLESHLEHCETCAELLESLHPEQDPMVLGLQQLELGSPDLNTYLTRTTRMDETQPTFQGPAQERPSVHRWELIELLAKGGIGEVWMARDRLLDRDVAVKRLREETAHIASVQRRFLYEARITAQLSHPCTVHVLDLVDDGPRSFYAMTLIRGKTLHQLIRECHNQSEASNVPASGAFNSLVRNWVSVVRTVSYAHSQHVLHRDLKSDNVVVGRFGQVTLIDWGLAKRTTDPQKPAQKDIEQETEDLLLVDGESTWETSPGSRLGTPSFMAPEQASGDSESIDHRTDNYALSAMLYEILTGVPPFEGGSAMEVMRSVCDDEVVPPRQREPWVPAQLEKICMKGLRKNPNERYQDAGELANEVEGWMTSETVKRQTIQARQKLFELSNDLMLIFDQRPVVLWANAAWKEKLGWEPRELMGKAPNQHVHPEDVGADVEVLEKLARGETASGMERRTRSSDGKYHWFSWTATPLIDEGIVCAIGRDIDAQVRRQMEYAALLEAAPDAMIVVDESARIHLVNLRTTEMFEFDRQELLEQSLQMLMPERHRAEYLSYIVDYFEKREVTSRFARKGLWGRRKSGEEFEMAIRLSPIEIESKRYVVASIRAVE